MEGFSPVSYRFIASAALTAAKTLIYRMKPENPSDLLNHFFRTDLTLTASDGEQLKMEEAVCTVSRTKTVTKTSLVGLDSTVKESIANADYALTISVGVAAADPVTGEFTDEYPAEGVARLVDMLDRAEALQVDSPFLGLFGINRIVVKSYSVKQMTDTNRQAVTIQAESDEEFEILCNEY